MGLSLMLPLTVELLAWVTVVFCKNRSTGVKRSQDKLSVIMLTDEEVKKKKRCLTPLPWLIQ